MFVPVSGRKNHQFSIDVSEDNEGADRLALLLPGVGYRLENPIFYFTRRLLLDNGYRIAGANYAYDKLEGFRDLSFEDVMGVLHDDAASIAQAMMQLPKHSELLVVGKSLGTVLMGNLLAQGHLQSALLAWLPPSSKVAQVPAGILKCAPKSFICIGDADKGYDANTYAEFATAGATLSVIDDLAHVLECDNNVPKSILGHHKMILDMQNWLSASNAN